MAASQLKSNTSNANLDKNKKKLFLYFDTSHVNQTNNFFSYIVNNNENLKKTDILDDSALAHVVQNPCGRDVNNFVRSSYDKEPNNPLKDSMVVFLMRQVEFLRDEIKIKNNIIERLLTLKSVLHDNQLSSYNSQQI